MQSVLNQDPATQVASTGAGSKGFEHNTFDTLTKIAVQKFQSKHSLSADGIVGPITRGVLNSVLGVKPTLTFTASSYTIKEGTTIQLYWLTENASSLSINQGIGQVSNHINGSRVVSPTITTTYIATAVGNESVSKSTTITVTPNISSPTVSFTTDKTRINSGETANLSWTTTNANTVTIDGGIGKVSDPTTGLRKVSPIKTTTYTLTATGEGGTTNKYVTITVDTNGISVYPSTLSNTIVGQYFVQPLAFTGGTAPYTTISRSTIPEGLELKDNTIKGTPRKTGTNVISLFVRDSSGQNTVKEYTLTVENPPPRVIGKTGNLDSILAQAKEVQTFIDANVNTTQSIFSQYLKDQVLNKLEALETNAKVYGLHVALGDGCGLFHSTCLTLGLPSITIGILVLWRWERMVRNGLNWINEKLSEYANALKKSTEEILSFSYRFGKDIVVTIVDEAKVCINGGGVQECLSTCGIALDAIPIAGTAIQGACDFTNGVIYLFKGDRLMAGASMLAVIPLAGGILKGSAKTAIKFTDEAALAVKISKYTDDLTKAGAKLLRKLDEVFNAGRVGRYSLEIDPITGLTYRAKHFRDHVINQPDLRRIYGNIPDEIALERLTQSFVSTKTSTKRFWQSMPGGKDQTRI
ncbi:MAG: peptidoglycan-binding protein, partial [Patescibacteria group bacterium]